MGSQLVPGVNSDACHDAQNPGAYYQYYDTAINSTTAGSTIGQICESWVEWRGKGFCDVDDLRKDVELSLSGAGSL